MSLELLYLREQTGFGEEEFHECKALKLKREMPFGRKWTKKLTQVADEERGWSKNSFRGFVEMKEQKLKAEENSFTICCLDAIVNYIKMLEQYRAAKEKVGLIPLHAKRFNKTKVETNT